MRPIPRSYSRPQVCMRQLLSRIMREFDLGLSTIAEKKAKRKP